MRINWPYETIVDKHAGKTSKISSYDMNISEEGYYIRTVVPIE